LGSEATRRTTPFAENIVLRAGVYYLALIGGAAALWYLWPHAQAAAPSFLDSQARTASELGPLGAAAAGGRIARNGSLALTVSLAMTAAVLLSLPVAWVYRLTRSKRGYQQSVVQMLVILPMVVAGVVVLVKDSLALAFGLAGIVAAVRFRTALDDSKDAMYVFLATGIGLASAVDLPVAAVLSTGFNTLILLFWYTDFGRQPAHLEGKTADRRLENALSHLSRTGTFVARVDDEVFRDMSAEQLQALVERAGRRARQNDPDGNGAAEERPEVRLRVSTSDPDGARQALEPALGGQAKRWRYAGMRMEPDGTSSIEYLLIVRKGVESSELLDGVRAALGTSATDAELV